MNLEKLIDLLIKNPLSVFIILSVGFGYLYYDQNQTLQSHLEELGGLRVEQVKMNDIIKLQVQLAEARCK